MKEELIVMGSNFIIFQHALTDFSLVKTDQTGRCTLWEDQLAPKDIEFSIRHLSQANMFSHAGLSYVI